MILTKTSRKNARFVGVIALFWTRPAVNKYLNHTSSYTHTPSFFLELQANIQNIKVSDIEDGLVKGNRLFDKGS